MSGPRSILLVRTNDTEQNEDAFSAPALNTVPLGSFAHVVAQLRDFNTAPDGSPDGRSVLHGPGITAQLPMLGDDDPVGQLLVSINDDEVAWPVLIRICRTLGWKMMDPQSGRTFG